jgi:hypothetical protein
VSARTRAIDLTFLGILQAEKVFLENPDAVKTKWIIGVSLYRFVRKKANAEMLCRKEI